jgi:hypothetical protein
MNGTLRMPVLLALFVLYFVAVTWQMRRAVVASDPRIRLRESVRLLFVVSAGVPLAVAFILIAL